MNQTHYGKNKFAAVEYIQHDEVAYPQTKLCKKKQVFVESCSYNLENQKGRPAGREMHFC